MKTEFEALSIAVKNSEPRRREMGLALARLGVLVLVGTLLKVGYSAIPPSFFILMGLGLHRFYAFFMERLAWPLLLGEVAALMWLVKEAMVIQELRKYHEENPNIDRTESNVWLRRGRQFWAVTVSANCALWIFVGACGNEFTTEGFVSTLGMCVIAICVGGFLYFHEINDIYSPIKTARENPKDNMKCARNAGYDYGRFRDDLPGAEVMAKYEGVFHAPFMEGFEHGSQMRKTLRAKGFDVDNRGDA
ncbi:glutamate synthase [Novimethylophilus kurashikiensis]|uniref:Glutamate synthase n=1 Tax=Novimethylophilus kurashikiensis TaxID=1825523 RepID=A0A2R5F9J1_9PROT|nr:hypothetical protein [Novimethylophilus kurashikiensis]GBG14886.1 glutamate synthase [Novimethylophilus kurashikiensis]